jgi:hypothetical protein
MRQIHEVYFFLEIIANLFYHELLLINVDLIIILAEAPDYDKTREPFVIILNEEVGKKILAFLDHL